MDFSDDAHVDAAVAKNKQTLLGKKLSIARSNPKQGKRDQSGRSLAGERGRSNLDLVTIYAAYVCVGHVHHRLRLSIGLDTSKTNFWFIT